MMQWEASDAAGRAEACRALLKRLPGVYAAGPRFDADGALTEIHVLASLKRNPKQVVRDVQSALFAAYGVEVDHRIVSVAQLPENPLEGGDVADSPEEDAPSPNVRLMVAGIDSKLDGGEYAISIRLAYDGQLFEGGARCRDTAIQRDRAAALAAVAAVNAFAGREVYALLEVKRTHLWGEPVALTALELLDGQNPRVLIGAALQGPDASLGIVHSALDALNRSLGRIRRSNDDS